MFFSLNKVKLFTCIWIFMYNRKRRTYHNYFGTHYNLNAVLLTNQGGKT